MWSPPVDGVEGEIWDVLYEVVGEDGAERGVAAPFQLQVWDEELSHALVCLYSVLGFAHHSRETGKGGKERSRGQTE